MKKKKDKIPQPAWWDHWQWDNEPDVLHYVIKMINDKGGFMPYFISNCTFSKVPFEVFRKYADQFHKPKILVVGSIPIHAIYLSYFYDVDVICPYESFIKLNKTMNREYHGNINILGHDLINLDKKKCYDIIYCGFTYENYKMKDAIKIMKSHLNKCDTLIVYSPINPEYNYREWFEIIERSGGKIVRTYGMDFPKLFRFANHIRGLSRLLRVFSKSKIWIIQK